MGPQRPAVAMLAGGRASGGSAYEDQVAAALAAVANVERPALPRSPGRRLLAMRRIRGQADVWIRDHAATAFASRRRTPGKQVSLLHHIDNSVKSPIRRALSTALDAQWRRKLRSMDACVAVSRHWASFLKAMGAPDVALIYNAFDPQEYRVTAADVERFRDRHRLAERPIVYLGNCQRAKGVVQAQAALKDLDAHLVTSGPRKVAVPTLNLDLSRRDYVCLLNASSVVVTMSLFDEGWCRTAHEAMLCGVPVVGSGRGGMAELLAGGGQTVCNDFAGLRQAVEAAQADRAMGERGRSFAGQPRFRPDTFASAWRNLVSRLVA